MEPVDQTIYAVASGRGRSGVAVIRVSGPDAGTALRGLCGDIPPPRAAVLRSLVSRETHDLLDKGLVIWMPGPASFSGEDVCEFHVHGGPAVVAAVLDELGRIPGLRPAEAGEFTRRAFYHGRLDLTQVEALADLINADTDAQRRQAQRQISGTLSEVYEAWRHELIQCLAYLEAEIDFPDEGDVPSDVTDGMKAVLEKLIGGIDAALSDERRGERLRDGFRVVIAGRPNVGKSSLLNAISERDAAIVSEYAGTTRDVIEVHLDLKGYPVSLIDTAGLRDTGNAIEQEGVARTRGRLEDADLVVWVTDCEDLLLGTPADIARCDPVWPIVNKSDLGTAVPQDFSVLQDGAAHLEVSAKTGAGLPQLISQLSAAVADSFSGGESVLVTRSRHRKALQDCRAHAVAAHAAWDGRPELVAEDVRLAARALGRVTGRVDVEDLLDVIFRDFCIGK